MSDSDYISSAGAIGNARDPINDRYRGMAPEFATTLEPLLGQWDDFAIEANREALPASRLTLRVITSRAIAVLAARHINAEAFVPLNQEGGVLYLGHNAPGRQAQLPTPEINSAVDQAAESIRSRFRPPAARVAELSERGYSFVDHITNQQELLELWKPTFGWGADGILDLNQRLADNDKRAPEDREVWFTGVLYQGHLVAAIMAERLDVPGPNGSRLPTIESTEWAVERNLRHKHSGLAPAMVAMNSAQCLRDLPNARLLAECRYSSGAYAVGMCVGFSIPERQAWSQILPRNVYVEGELADFVVVSLPDQSVQDHYSPADRTAILSHLNR